MGVLRFSREERRRRATSGRTRGWGGSPRMEREESARAIITVLRARHPMPRFVDLEATVSLLSAATTLLALYAGAGVTFVGLDPQRPDHWHRVERGLAQLVQALLGDPEE